MGHTVTIGIQVIPASNVTETIWNVIMALVEPEDFDNFLNYFHVNN